MTNTRRSIFLEIAGMIALFVVLGWDIIIGDELNNEVAGLSAYRTEEKVGLVWQYVTYIGTDQVIERNDLRSKWNTLDRLGEPFEQQNRTIIAIRAIVFLVGSLALTLGRYLELKNKLPQTK